MTESDLKWWNKIHMNPHENLLCSTVENLNLHSGHLWEHGLHSEAKPSTSLWFNHPLQQKKMSNWIMSSSFRVPNSKIYLKPPSRPVVVSSQPVSSKTPTKNNKFKSVVHLRMYWLMKIAWKSCVFQNYQNKEVSYTPEILHSPLKTNMEPENTPLEKEKHLQTSNFFGFWVPC